MTDQDKGFFDRYWAKRQKIEREKEAMRLKNKSGQPLEAITERFLNRVEDPNTLKCEKCGEMFMLNTNNRLVHDHCPAITKQFEVLNKAKSGQSNAEITLVPPRRSYTDDYYDN